MFSHLEQADRYLVKIQYVCLKMIRICLSGSMPMIGNTRCES